VIDKLGPGEQRIDRRRPLVGIRIGHELADFICRWLQADQVQVNPPQELFVRRQVRGPNFQIIQLGNDVPIDVRFVGNRRWREVRIRFQHDQAGGGKLPFETRHDCGFTVFFRGHQSLLCDFSHSFSIDRINPQRCHIAGRSIGVMGDQLKPVFHARFLDESFGRDRHASDFNLSVGIQSGALFDPVDQGVSQFAIARESRSTAVRNVASRLLHQQARRGVNRIQSARLAVTEDRLEILVRIRAA
jgi:hypothetical protein